MNLTEDGMGREATARAEVGAEAGTVRILLESDELILRGDIRRRFPRDRLAELRSGDGVLRFSCDGEAVALHLGADAAARWEKAIATPPPSLRAKLGLASGAKAYRVGVFVDDALAEALAGAVAETVDEADMIVACIMGPDDLAMALKAHKRRLELPLWTVHPKGRGARLHETQIREELRARGYRDTKSCAVSHVLTANRYNLPAAATKGT
jgi:hypothetical protein